MFPTHERQRADERSLATKSVEGFITWAAAVTALFGGVILYDYTGHLMADLALETWGEKWLALIDFAYRIACFPIVFFLARASFYFLWAAIAVVAFRYGPSLAF